MKISAIKTRPIVPPQDDIYAVLDEVITTLPPKSIVVVSSKIVAIHQGRTVAIPSGVDITAFKDELAKKEADTFLNRDERYPYSRLFTMNDGVFGSMSGIDASNGNGHIVLLPEDSMRSAKDLHTYLAKKHAATDFGVIVTDSRTLPMRKGTIGIALGYAGFCALYDYRGTKDIFGRVLAFERVNIADSVATAANLVMGEGDECTPIAVVTDVPHVVFEDDSDEKDLFMVLKSKMEEDVFAQFLVDRSWKKGGANQ